MRPLLIYDGDCELCRFWAGRWRARTGELVDYVPFQRLAGKIPGISEAEFRRAVWLVELTGNKYQGAAAIFKLWAYSSRLGKILWWCHQHVPLLAALSEGSYRVMARNRVIFWRLTKLVIRTKRF